MGTRIRPIQTKRLNIVERVPSITLLMTSTLAIADFSATR